MAQRTLNWHATRAFPTKMVRNPYFKMPKSTSQSMMTYKMVDRVAKKPVFEIDRSFTKQKPEYHVHRVMMLRDRAEQALV